MKIRRFFLAFAIMASALLFTSCYDEGSKINPEERIVGVWELSHTYLNGEEIDSTTYYANKPGTYYYIYADHIMTVMALYNGQIRESSFSTYYFSNKYQNITVDFSLLGRRYQYTAAIKKLSRKQFFIEYDDANENHWRLEMNSRSSY